MSALDHLLHYLRRGWAIIPVPFRSKNPGFKGWEQLRISTETVGQYFNGEPQNIGVLLGEPSGWLIDIDLDHMRAVELAQRFLPATPAVFGRASKPRSHWIYRVTAPAVTKKFRSKSAGMLVEFRSTGMQTIFPPSTHESGEAIGWDQADDEPATVEPGHLLECVQRLADAVKVELGEKQTAPEKKKRTQTQRLPAEAAATTVDLANRSAQCLAAMLRIRITDQRDGSHRLFVASCRAVEHALDDAAALATIREYARHNPFPRSWNDEEIIQRVRDAEGQCRRGQALEVDAEGCIGLGGRDPLSGRLVLSPKKTLPTSEAYVRDFHLHPEGRAVQCYAGLLMEWQDNRYREVEDSVTMKLPTRFMFLTNEFPRLHDASGALAGRFVILRLTESFYGKEDTGLTDRLLNELPGILNWSIEGWRRLRERGHFMMPTSVRDVAQEIEDLSSPVSAFVRDACIVGAGHRVSVDSLYDAWKRWCEDEGRQAVTTKQTFGRDLAAAVAGISRRRGTAQQPFYEGIALKGGW